MLVRNEAEPLPGYTLTFTALRPLCSPTGSHSGFSRPGPRGLTVGACHAANLHSLSPPGQRVPWSRTQSVPPIPCRPYQQPKL